MKGIIFKSALTFMILYGLGDSALQNTLLCMNNNIWMDDEDANKLLMQFAEDYLGKE